MSDHPNDGGPAFPFTENDHFRTMQGMSLRDWFAGQAMVGILGARNGFLVDTGTESVAPWAYEAADAMLAEREKERAQ